MKPRFHLYLLRAPLLLAHIAIALPCTLVVINPLGQRLRWGERSVADAMINWWSATVCKIFGLRIRIVGELPPSPIMLVADHISWVDIEVLHATRVFSFVAKAEIAQWPIVGLMARAGGTVFHARGDSQSREQVGDAFLRKLQEGRSVAIFAEGRTSDGRTVLPFHGRMFQPAIDAGSPLLPAALRYRCGDVLVNPVVAFGPGESFAANLVRLLGLPSIDVDIVLGEQIRDQGQGRRAMALAAREHVIAALEETIDFDDMEIESCS